jgi:cyclase
MLTRRVIVCLDVAGGRVVKGVQFTSLRDVGDPVELAAHYEREGADEIVFLDITATAEARETTLSLAQRTAESLFIPLTIGGGVGSVEEIAKVLRAGADKVSVNSAAVRRPQLLAEAAAEFGAQCVVISIDARRDNDGRWRVFTHGGRMRTELDALEWAREAADRGAGEILLTSIDRDGSRSGYDLELTRAVSESVRVPVIASGGAGSAADVTTALEDGKADAALVAGILHDGITSVAGIKHAMSVAGLPVREAA